MIQEDPEPGEEGEKNCGQCGGEALADAKLGEDYFSDRGRCEIDDSHPDEEYFVTHTSFVPLFYGLFYSPDQVCGAFDFTVISVILELHKGLFEQP